MTNYDFSGLFHAYTSPGLIKTQVRCHDFFISDARPSSTYEDYKVPQWAPVSAGLVPEFSAGGLVGLYRSRQQLRLRYPLSTNASAKMLRRGPLVVPSCLGNR